MRASKLGHHRTAPPRDLNRLCTGGSRQESNRVRSVRGAQCAKTPRPTTACSREGSRRRASAVRREGRGAGGGRPTDRSHPMNPPLLPVGSVIVWAPWPAAHKKWPGTEAQPARDTTVQQPIGGVVHGWHKGKGTSTPTSCSTSVGRPIRLDRGAASCSHANRRPPPRWVGCGASRSPVVAADKAHVVIHPQTVGRWHHASIDECHNAFGCKGGRLHDTSAHRQVQ